MGEPLTWRELPNILQHGEHRASHQALPLGASVQWETRPVQWTWEIQDPASSHAFALAEAESKRHEQTQAAHGLIMSGFQSMGCNPFVGVSSDPFTRVA